MEPSGSRGSSGGGGGGGAGLGGGNGGDSSGAGAAPSPSPSPSPSLPPPLGEAVAAWVGAADAARELGSPPHGALPMAIARQMGVGIRELIRVKAGAFALRFVPSTMEDEVAALIRGLGVRAWLGVDARGAGVAVRLRLGDCDPEVLLPLGERG